MTNRKARVRVAAFSLFFISCAAFAVNWYVVAAGVLTAAVAVVAAPAVGVAVGSAAVGSLIASGVAHIGAAIAITGLLMPSSTTIPATANSLVQSAQSSPAAKPITVNLTPMSASQKTAWQARQAFKKTAANTHPQPATSGSGSAAAQSTAQSKIGAAVDWVNNQFSGQGVASHVHAFPQCTDNGSSWSCAVQCSADTGYNNYCLNMYNGFPWGTMVNNDSERYTAGTAAVTCPSGSHQIGTGATASCKADAIAGAPAIVVTDPGGKPVIDSDGIPDDATISADGSTLTRSVQSPDGSAVRTDVMVQSDGSLDVVDSSYSSGTGNTSHVGMAVDNNGDMVGFAGAVSNGNYAGPPVGGGVIAPNGSGNGGTGQTGTGGTCGGPGQGPCEVDWNPGGQPVPNGASDGPAVPDADVSAVPAAYTSQGHLDKLLSFAIPAHTSTCPTFAVDLAYFGKPGKTSDSSAVCHFVDDNRQTLGNVFLLLWALAAVIIVLGA